PLSAEQGLALLDAALARTDAALVPALFDTQALQAQVDALPPLLRGLVRARPARRNATNAAHASSLIQQLLPLPHADRISALLDLVRAEVATVLGFASPTALDPLRPLQELGLDSLMAVELRNRLAAKLALRLRATLLFDYPTPIALAQFFATEL